MDSRPPRRTRALAAGVPAPPSLRAPRFRALLAVAVLACSGAALLVAAARDGLECSADDALVWIEEDGLRYDFHVPSGTESLWRSDAPDGPDGPDAPAENLVRELPAEAARLRAELARRLGVGDLAELRAKRSGQIARLGSLGYF